uniref:Uncharacterized protein n=1 Tax=Caenorhabditis japonica TaxID=281687 RepID=A0A8R1HSG3_CAEJA
MANIIGEPLDIINNKEIHQLYEDKGMLAENNTLNVSFKDMELCHKHWPDNFEALYDIGAKAFENFLIERCHLAKLFKLDQVKADSWRQHFVLDRCVLHMLQMLHEAISKYHEEMRGIKTDENFYKKLQTFGGRYRSLAPKVPVQEYFYLFGIWSEMHMDFIALTCYEGPVCSDERNVVAKVWEKIIDSIKVHFVYGWHHKMYTMTRDELEYFFKEDKAIEPARSKLLTKLSRLLSRESFNDAISEDKTLPARKSSQTSKDLSVPGAYK